MASLLRPLQAVNIDALRSAFIAMLPLIVVLNLLPIINSGLGQWAPFSATAIEFCTRLHHVLSQLLPSLLLVSHALAVAPKYQLDRYVVCATALVAACTASWTIHQQLWLGSILGALLVSSTTIGLYRLNQRWQVQLGQRFQGILSHYLDRSVSLIAPCVLILPSVILVYVLAHDGAQWLLSQMASWYGQGAAASDATFLFLYTGITQIAWFFGLHGPNLASDFLQAQDNAPHLKAVIDNFSALGGSGNSLCLLIALWLSKPTAHERSIAKLATPFALLNINEILLYGLPVVLNPLLLIPFLLAPLIGVGIALAGLHFDLFVLAPTQMSWMTPALMNIWHNSGGSLDALCLQVLSLLAGCLVYFPFVRRVQRRNLEHAKMECLFSNQSGQVLRDTAEQVAEQRYQQQQLDNQAMQARFHKAIDLLTQGEFQIYLQPKFCADARSVCGAEVLLRLRDRRGTVHSPFFLDDLYRLGLSSMVDELVTELTLKQAHSWRAQAFPEIPLWVNLDKPFLLDDQKIKALAQHIQRVDWPIHIEMTEHSYSSDIQKLTQVTDYLRARGIKVSIDDFGNGFSSLALLRQIKVDEVKLDRALITYPEHEQARANTVLQHVIALCRSLDYQIVSEGVESEAQCQQLRDLGVDMLQGYWLGRPMPSDEFERLLQQASTPSQQTPNIPFGEPRRSLLSLTWPLKKRD